MVTRTLMRNAIEALGSSEAFHERMRFDGNALPASSAPFAADHFRGAVHELFARGEEHLLITLVAAFAEGLGEVPVAMSEKRMMGVVEAVISPCGGNCDVHVRDGVKRLLLTRMYASVWSAVPMSELTPLLSPRHSLGDLPLVNWRVEALIAESAVERANWASHTSLNNVECRGTYHPENRYTFNAPVTLDAIGAHSIQNGVHRLHAAAQGGASEAVVFVWKRHTERAPGRALSPEVLSFR